MQTPALFALKNQLVEGKAKEATSDNLWWAIIKLPGNKSGYVNAQELAYDTSLKEVENNFYNKNGLRKLKEFITSQGGDISNIPVENN